MNRQVHTQSFQLPDGQEVTIETGKLATQAHGSVVVTVGNMMLFASVVSAHEAREGQPFFPLSVDYQEKFAAAGRIPGNFFRRETRLSNYEILISRLVDRAIRPLFPDGYMNDTQVIVNLISGDPEILPDAYAALAVSAALSTSDIPWAGPLSEVRVAKIDGKYKVNPHRTELESATLDIIVAATLDNVMMVEGEADECSEQELIDAIKVAHDAIKTQCTAQLDLAQKVGEKATVKRVLAEAPTSDEVKDIVAEHCSDDIWKVCRGAMAKHDRKEAFSDLYSSLKEKLTESKGEEWMSDNKDFLKKYFEKKKKEIIRAQILQDGKRLDGRATDEIRDIWCEVDYLKSTHGSAIFTRGETQALTSLTLGSKRDEQMIDNALGQYNEPFILHYNFPALSVGEIKPMRGPGRREVGHANLAQRSLKQVMPDDYAYTVRLVSDILESNGSSSMATVCAGALAMMDGGVPLKSPVSGIAMGLVKEGDQSAVLSDILGDEDAVGDMDFKVTGTQKGICACQMDIKIDGLPYDLLTDALEQARKGRLHILGEMAKTLEAPREDYKSHVPRIEVIRIDKTFIGAIIGPGGKNIQELQARTNTTIAIDEDENNGIVQIMSEDAAGMKEAIDHVKMVTYMPSVGDVVDAKVASVMPYGVFVDFGGRSGLLHVSEFDWKRVENVSEYFKEGDEVTVKIVDIDQKSGKFRLSRKVLLERPERRDDNRS